MEELEIENERLFRAINNDLDKFHTLEVFN